MTPEPPAGAGAGAPTPPPRVRVTAPIAQARRAPGRPVAGEIAELSEVGQVYVRSLIRSQLLLAVVVAVGFLLILLAFPLLIAYVPGLEQAEFLGVPFSWLALGVGVYPIILLSAWLHVRAAARNEARYLALVDGA